MAAAAATPRRRLGRYELYDEFARGGMASVHLGRLVGPVGFARPVAIKCLHPAYASDPAVVRMFIDEARLTARLRHPNVVPIVDVLAEEGHLYLVMDYVQGLSLARVLAEVTATGGVVPRSIACAIMIGVLSGLHAAHEATGDGGEPLGIVHRDVSPHNVIVGEDGVARVLDFGVAKATSRMQETTQGEIKGKLAYMSPEQLAGQPVDRRSDVFAASIVFWEVLTGQRLFARGDPGATVTALLHGPIDAPSDRLAGVPSALSELVVRGLSRDVAERPSSALAMLKDLEAVGGAASAREVGDWITELSRAAGLLDAARAAGIDEASVSTAAPANVAAGGEPARDTTALFVSAPAVARPHVTAHRRRVVPALLVAFAALVVAVGIGASRVRANDAQNVASIAPPDPQAIAPPDPHAIAPPDPQAIAPAAKADVPPVAATLPDAPSASPRPAAAASSVATARRPRATPPKRAHAPRADCRVVNPDGTFEYRAECLR